ncbi:hypothetical protein B0H16DRAFT_1490927 [Mycena metata]|uniref:Uncharacterized protein n=1 Tax=Mycena metata TaxID=1033252 RepID=A0AAD7KJR9_9AGAR|nr:hypothetical protein B0H16DRAFT_1490927 [Mycena metata]
MKYCCKTILCSTMSTSHSERSLFVTLAAQAMSSVGFSVVRTYPFSFNFKSNPQKSILAWIWLTLVPPKPELTEPILIDKKARRRSAPPAFPSRKRNSLSPSAATRSPTSEVLPSPISPPRTRRVYFLDSPTPSSRPSIERNDSSSELNRPFSASPTEISPSSSSSTLVHVTTHTAIPPRTLETWRESAVESDSSNSSPRPSLSLSRPFRTRRSSGTSDVPDVTPIITAPTSDSKHGRKGSGSFIPPWAFRRASGSKPAAVSPSTATTAPAAPSSSASPPIAPTPSYFTRKTSRRVSTPVPRTQPYAHPYYAQPPIEDDPSVAHLRSQPQFELQRQDAIVTTTVSDSEKDLSSKDPPALDARGRNRKAQAALGVGRPRLRPQRSASESWAAGKEPRL